jgi:predicted enzyme related to lactoylglutathione lyase
LCEGVDVTSTAPAEEHAEIGLNVGAGRHDVLVRGRSQADESTPRLSRHDWWGVVLDAPDARSLARFYASLLGWELAADEADGATVAPREGVAYLGFQTSPEYVRPVWPTVEGSQQMMLHLDFEVSDLETAVNHAVELGAQEAKYQPQENVRVLLDPAGHPFCLYLDK